MSTFKLDPFRRDEYSRDNIVKRVNLIAKMLVDLVHILKLNLSKNNTGTCPRDLFGKDKRNIKKHRSFIIETIKVLCSKRTNDT